MTSPYAFSLQAWRSGLSLWQAGFEMQLSMLRGFYGLAPARPEAADPSRRQADSDAPAVDFAKRAAQGIEAAQPPQTDDLPV